MKLIFILLTILLLPSIYANEPKVIKVKVLCQNSNICSFFVTINHKDTGWKHYVNKYEILNMKKEIIATRILHHPHVKEQPFTRSISNVKIPKNQDSVIVRAHDLLHGYKGNELVVKIK